MPQRCSVCCHAARAAIDGLLLESVPLSRIAAEYPPLSPSALHRHRVRHLTQPMKAALEARHESQVAYGGDLLRRLEGLYARAQGLLERAEQQGSLTGALSAIRETRECLRIIGQTTKEISSSVTVAVFVQSPTWERFKAALVGALAPHPSALHDVREAFRVLTEAPGYDIPAIEPPPQPGGTTDRSDSKESNWGHPERR